MLGQGSRCLLAGSAGTHGPLEVTSSLVRSKWSRRLSASSRNVGFPGILVLCLSGYNTMQYPFKADLTSSRVLLLFLTRYHIIGLQV